MKFYVDLGSGTDAELRKPLNASRADLLKAWYSNPGDVSGRWTVSIPGITASSLVDGLTIRVRITQEYNNNYNTLNVNGLGNKLVYYRQNSLLTNHIGQWAEVLLTYRKQHEEVINGITYTMPGAASSDQVRDGVNYGTDGWILDYSYSDGNNYDRLINTYECARIGDRNITQYKLCMFDNNDVLYPVSIGSSTTGVPVTTNTPINVPLKPDRIIYMPVAGTYDNDWVVARARGTTDINTLYEDVPIEDITYTINSTLPPYSKLYLVGTLNRDGLFVLDTSSANSFYKIITPSTTTNSSTAANTFTFGKYYLFVGSSPTQANYLQLLPNHELFYCADTEGKVLTPAAHRWQASDINLEHGPWRAGNDINKYTLLFEEMPGSLVSIQETNNSTATNKSLSSVPFQPFGRIFYYNSTIITNSTAYIDPRCLQQNGLVDLRYTFNVSNTTGSSAFNGAKGTSLYLKVAQQIDYTVYVNSNYPLVSTLPTTADNYFYIYLGQLEDWNLLRLTEYHPVFKYSNGRVVRVSPSEIDVHTGTPNRMAYYDGTNSIVSAPHHIYTNYQYTIEDAPTLGGASPAFKLQGLSQSISLTIDSGNIIRGLKDETNNTWIIYKDATAYLRTPLSIVPALNATIDLGTDAIQWNNGYIKRLFINSADNTADTGIGLKGTDITAFGISLRASTAYGWNSATDWNTHFYMSHTTANTYDRGWQFRYNDVPVVSINGQGYITAAKLSLQRQDGVANGRIHWSSFDRDDWVTYITDDTQYTSPTGTPLPLGSITSWAFRNRIPSTANYGWIWESVVEYAPITENAIPRMALSAATGQLYLSTTHSDAFTIVNNSLVSGTAGYADLILGNDVDVNTTDEHSEGRIKIYSAGVGAHIIQGENIPDNVLHLLPSSRGTLASLHYCLWTIESGQVSVVLNKPLYYNLKTIVISLVVTSGMEYLDGPITWTPGTGTLTLMTSGITSGAISGYVITSEADDIT